MPVVSPLTFMTALIGAREKKGRTPWAPKAHLPVSSPAWRGTRRQGKAFGAFGNTLVAWLTGLGLDQEQVIQELFVALLLFVSDVSPPIDMKCEYYDSTYILKNIPLIKVDVKGLANLNDWSKVELHLYGDPSENVLKELFDGFSMEQDATALRPKKGMPKPSAITSVNGKQIMPFDIYHNPPLPKTPSSPSATVSKTTAVKRGVPASFPLPEVYKTSKVSGVVGPGAGRTWKALTESSFALPTTASKGVQAVPAAFGFASAAKVTTGFGGKSAAWNGGVFGTLHPNVPSQGGAINSSLGNATTHIAAQVTAFGPFIGPIRPQPASTTSSLTLNMTDPHNSPPESGFQANVGSYVGEGSGAGIAIGGRNGSVGFTGTSLNLVRNSVGSDVPAVEDKSGGNRP